MNIRLLQSADAAKYQSLRLEGLRECPSAFASSVEEEIDTPIAEVAERLAPAADRARFGAFIDADLVGVAGIKRESMRKLAHKAYIWGVYVSPACRGLGIGRRLIEQVLEHGKNQLGVLQVNLGVNASNVAAIALYERCGFERYGFERRFMIVDGVSQDELLMARLFSEAP